MVNWKEENLGNDLETVRKRQKTVLENVLEHRITVLAQQPGIGKTTMIIDFLKNTELRCAVIVPYHKLVKSEYVTKLQNMVHWQGFDYFKCEKYEELEKKYGKLLKMLSKKNFICPRECGKMRSCDYHLQFENVEQHVITVPEFLKTPYFDKQKFDLIIFDESVERGEDFYFNEEELAEFFKIINEELYDGALSNDIEYFLESISLFDDVAGILNADAKEVIENKINGPESLSSLNPSLISVSPYSLKTWLFYDKIYDLGHEMAYRKPFIYDALTKNIPLVISDATFNQSFFDALYQQYCEEYGLDNDIGGIIYRSNVSQKDRKIIKLYKNNMFYKSSIGIKQIKIGGENIYIVNSDKPDIHKVLNTLERISGHYYNCGFISYKAFELDPNITIPDCFEFLNIGNTRGLNTFEDKRAVVICGTHLVGDEGGLESYNKLFRKIYTKEDFQRDDLTDDKNCIKWKDSDGKKIILEENFRKKPKGLISINNEKMREDNYGFSPRDYVIYQIDSTAYQNIHRTRFFLNDMEVYIMGYIPERLYSEVEVEELTSKQSEAILENEFRGIHPFAFYKRITDFQSRNHGINVTDIAKHFKLRDGTKYNTKFVTAMIEYMSHGLIQKIDDEIKRGIDEPSKFKKSTLDRISVQKAYSTEEFLIDCIRYSRSLNLNI